MNYMAFDLEIAQEIPEGCTDWREHSPLGITCAATLSHPDGELRVWCGWDELGRPAAQMSPAEVADLVSYLQTGLEHGYVPIGWNSCSFDFAVLAEESGLVDECKELARRHVDMMLHFLCVKGYPLGLQAASLGMGLEGKTEGMSGALAPVMWSEEKFDEVMEYVAQDTRATLDLALAVEEGGALLWTSKAGRPNTCRFPDGWLTVEGALRLPEPDTSWMSSPLTRDQFAGWLA